MRIELPLVLWLLLHKLQSPDMRGLDKDQNYETFNFLSAPPFPPLWRAISGSGPVRILYNGSQIFFLNHLDVVYETGKTVFNQISNKRVKNMRHSEVFLKKIEVFGNVVKPCLQCLTCMYRYLKS